MRKFLIQGKKISVVIPCYNEEEGLPFVLEAISKQVDEIIVVDNNSTDFTSKIATDFGATVIREQKKGYGFAYKKGLELASGELIVCLDGDGTYPANEIEKLVNLLIDKKLDFISCCRFPLVDEKVMDKWSKFGNWALTFFTEILFHFKLKDSQSGMWVFEKKILENKLLKFDKFSNGMAFSQELKIQTIRAKLKFEEIHIPYYTRFGEKKLKKLRDGVLNLLNLFYLKFFM